MIASASVLVSLSFGYSAQAQGRSFLERGERLDDTALVPLVFDGIVLESDGAPSAGAVVVSSAGGQVVTGLDGRYRLEAWVPLAARNVRITAIPDAVGRNLRAGASVALPAASGTAPVEPLVFAPARECSPRWVPTFGGQPGMDRDVQDLMVFDDGSGAALYAAGDFYSAGGVPAQGIAKWNGARWRPLGSGLSGSSRALTLFDDGSGPALYAGGGFASAGGAPANGIAKWDGASWSPLGSGMNATVEALTVFDDAHGLADTLGSGPALYAAGWFTTAGGMAANRIAKWDGSSWSALGSGMNSNVFALAVFDDGSGPALYAGGGFTTAGGVPANRIARWDGASWSALGSGMNSFVSALTVFDDGLGPALYAGGDFTTAGGVAAQRIARWDGSSWTALGDGLAGAHTGVSELAVLEDAHGLADTLGLGPALYAAGRFTTAGGVPATGIAKWDGSNWSALENGVGQDVLALAAFDDGTGPALYAGGAFTDAGGEAANRIARWSGSSWSALGSGLNREVGALTVFDDGGGPALYAGGFFTAAGGSWVNRVARWNGTGWSALGSGVDGFSYFEETRVETLAVFDDGSGPALHAGGFFTTAGGVPANHVAKWDGSSWSALGSGLDFTVFALTVFDDGGGPALYAGGGFSNAGGVPANRIARWDGASWSALGSGLSGLGGSKVMALAVFDDGSGPALYAGGQFTSAGGVPANRIAKWDGASWSALGTGIGTGQSESVLAMRVFDDGSGPALHVGGSFGTAGGTALNRCARWDGSSWSPVGGGMSTSVADMAVFDDGNGRALYVGGSAPESGDSYLARWGCPVLKTRTRKL